jgi:hypothetical protein
VKNRSGKDRGLVIPSSRWLAYATASAATLLTTANSATAEIHYSGPVDIPFPPDHFKAVALPLDQPGDSLIFKRSPRGQGSADFFGAVGLKSGAFLGSYRLFEYAFVWRIRSQDQDRYISEGHFTNGGFGFGSGTMIKGSRTSLQWQWERKGDGFIGFRFDNGAGRQYGWVRVRMHGPDSGFAFKVIDYAWADPGEPIRAGQTSSSISANPSKEGSLGLLALGGAGLALWRQRRMRGSV